MQSIKPNYIKNGLHMGPFTEIADAIWASLDVLKCPPQFSLKAKLSYNKKYTSKVIINIINIVKVVYANL